MAVSDASDRVAQVETPEAAQDLVERALVTRDDVLARATIQKAMSIANTSSGPYARKWEAVLASYLDAHPHLTEVVEELGQIEDLTKPDLFGAYSLRAPQGIAPHAINSATAAQR